MVYIKKNATNVPQRHLKTWRHVHHFCSTVRIALRRIWQKAPQYHIPMLPAQIQRQSAACVIRLRLTNFTSCCIILTYMYTVIINSLDSCVQVKGISGQNRGLVGSLINIDEGNGIVKSDADSALKIFALDNLAKYVPKQH